jgi:hypothetical protein
MSTLPTTDELYRTMRASYDELIAFVTTPNFQRLHAALYALPERERPRYVEEVFLNPERLRANGVVVPEGILIQRSSFGDRRPTLFCVKKYLPPDLQVFWQNVNITFDNDVLENVLDDERAWRKPLPVDAQKLLMEHDMTAEDLGV